MTLTLIMVMDCTATRTHDPNESRGIHKTSYLALYAKPMFTMMRGASRVNIGMWSRQQAK